jgi:hypothetical protein
MIGLLPTAIRDVVRIVEVWSNVRSQYDYDIDMIFLGVTVFALW